MYSRKDGVWKIADFGITSQGTSKSFHTTSSAAGTQGYRAPELVKGQPHSFNNKVDIWAAGCILYELAVGSKAFADDWAAGHFSPGEKLEITLDNNIDQDAQKCLIETINCLLRFDPRKRPPAWLLLSKIRNCRPSLNDSNENYMHIHQEFPHTKQTLIQGEHGDTPPVNVAHASTSSSIGNLPLLATKGSCEEISETLDPSLVLLRCPEAPPTPISYRMINSNPPASASTTINYVSNDASTRIMFVTVNIVNTRFAVVYASANSRLEEYIEVRALSDPEVFWEQKRPAQPGPHLISFSEGGKFLVFRQKADPRLLKVLDVYSLKTLAIVKVTEVPMAISFSDHVHRLAVAIQKDGRPPTLCAHSLPDQSELTPTVFVSEDTIEVDMSGERGAPEIFYSGDGENIFLVQWLGKQGNDGDLEITGWNVGTRSCVTRITYATNFRRWPNELPRLPPCSVTQNHIAVRGRFKSDLSTPVTLIVSLTSGSKPQEVALHHNASFIVTVPAGFVFIRDRIMELWTPSRGLEYLGELDSSDEVKIEGLAMAFTLSECCSYVRAVLNDRSLRIWEQG